MTEGRPEVIISNHQTTMTIMADPDALEELKNAAETAQSSEHGTCKVVLKDALSGDRISILFRRAHYSHIKDERSIG